MDSSSTHTLVVLTHGLFWSFCSVFTQNPWRGVLSTGKWEKSKSKNDTEVASGEVEKKKREKYFFAHFILMFVWVFFSRLLLLLLLFSLLLNDSVRLKCQKDKLLSSGGFTRRKVGFVQGLKTQSSVCLSAIWSVFSPLREWGNRQEKGHGWILFCLWTKERKTEKEWVLVLQQLELVLKRVCEKGRVRENENERVFSRLFFSLSQSVHLVLWSEDGRPLHSQRVGEFGPIWRLERFHVTSGSSYYYRLRLLRN